MRITKDVSSNYCGWAGEDVLKEHFYLFGDNVDNISTYKLITDIKDKRFMGWEINRKVLGKDLPVYIQEIGDCVSFGAKQVNEYNILADIFIRPTEFDNYKELYAPYFYGTGRVQIGGGRLWGDGSLGVWQQDAVKQYGILASDTPGLQKYQGSIAKSWGRNGPPSNFLEIGKKHLVRVTAKVTSAEDCAIALMNGYYTSVCSDWGFNMQASRDGFHAPRGVWNHCMSICGFEWHPQYGLYFIILNSWGNVHGRLVDFQTGEQLPAGCLRVRGEYLDKMLKQGDSYTYSNVNGFEERSKELQKSDFYLWK